MTARQKMDAFLASQTTSMLIALARKLVKSTGDGIDTAFNEVLNALERRMPEPEFVALMQELEAAV